MRGVTLKKTEAGTSPERLSSTNMGVPGAWCHPEEDGDGDKAGALTYPQGTRRKKTEAGTRPERLSSTNMGCQVRGCVVPAQVHSLCLIRSRRQGQSRCACPRPMYRVPGLWSPPRCVASNLTKSEARTRPGDLSSTNMGYRVHRLSLVVPGASEGQVRGLNLKKTEAGTRPERLSSTNMGSQVRGRALKKTEAGTRPERLSSTNMGCQVRGCVVPAQVHSLCLIRSRRQGQSRCACPRPMYRVPGLWSPPRCVASNLTKSEARTRPGDLSSTNMGYRVHRLGLVVPGASEG